GDHLEATVVRRPGLAGDGVGYASALTREQLLERRFEVEQPLGGELDLIGERGYRRRGRRLVAVVQIGGADRRLADRRQRPLAAEQGTHLDPSLDLRRGGFAQQVGEAEIGRDRGAGAPAGGLAVDPGPSGDVGP